MNTQIATALIASLVLTLLLVPVLSAIARIVGLVDKPTGRKQHSGEVPIVGGLAIFLAVCCINLLFNQGVDIAIILGLCSLMLLVGVVDDYTDLPTLLRLMLQIFIAGLMVKFAGVEIYTVGNILGSGDALVPPLFTGVFTIICVVGVINAINMIDGVDGLAGSIILWSFSALVLFSMWGAQHDAMVLAISMVGALAGFLYYNSRLLRSRATVFLGDAGSMGFALLLVWYFVRLSQGENAPLSAVAAGWIFGFPLADTVSVMVARLRKRQSPMQAGRDHFHHVALDMGFKPNQVLFIVGLIHFTMILVGIFCSFRREYEPVLFWIFVLYVILHHFYLPSLLSAFAPRTNES